MVDILLTHSYFLRFDPKQWRAMMPYPPLGTLFAASYVRQYGYTVSLFDSMLAWSEEEFRASLEIHKPKIVAIFDDDFNYLTKMCLSRMREAAFRLSTMAKESGAFVVVHGSDPTDHIEKYFSHCADVVIVGEGEETLLEVCSAFLSNSGNNLSMIPGIAFLENGRLVKTEKRPLRKNLDQLPLPAWDLVDIERYRSAWKKRHGYFSVNLVTTRGCPFHCNWCAKPIYGQVYHSRSPEGVLKEIEFLQSAVKPDHIWFADDIFGLKPGWIERFSQLIHDRGVRIPFKCLSRADLLLQGNAVRALSRAHCESVWIGAESGSQKVLDNMEKGITVEQILAASDLLHQYGINVGFFLQFGYPGETREDIESTIAMVRRCRPDEIGISVSYPLPGTKFYERVKAQLGEKQNWIDSDDLDVFFCGQYTRQFYRVLHRFVHKEFQLLKARTILRRIFRRCFPSRSELRTLVLVPYYVLKRVQLRTKLNRLAAIPNTLLTLPRTSTP